MTDPEEFWDAVFRRGDRRWVKDRSADELVGSMMMVGPFEEDLERARSVLDVGPGEARLLRRTRSVRKAWAIEVSSGRRAELDRLGIHAVAPDCGPYLVADLAWSTGCFQHCTPEMQKTLLRQVFKALRPGGVFYLQCVQHREGFPDCREEDRLPAGRYCVPFAEFMQWPETDGFTCTNLVWQHMGRDCPIIAWWVRLVKDAPVAGEGS